MGLLFRSSLSSGGGDSDSYGVNAGGNFTPASYVRMAPLSSQLKDYETFNENIVIGNNITHIDYLCSELESFNQPINLPNSVISCVGTFEDCYSFNQPINLPDSVTEVARMFSGCEEFNQPISFPRQIVNMSDTFAGCTNFNQPVQLPETIGSKSTIGATCSGLFRDTSFNQPINLPLVIQSPVAIKGESYAPYSCMFARTPFNQLLNIPDNAANLSEMFYDTKEYNQPVTMPYLPNKVIHGEKYTQPADCTRMFASSSFNQPIYNMNNIKAGIFSHMFWYALNFNQPIDIPPSSFPLSGQDCTGMFKGACYFNSPITFLGDNYISCAGMFAGEQGVHTIFNQALVLPKRVEDCSKMFDNCYFNNSLTMPEEVFNCSYMFNGSGFNQNITIPKTVINCAGMFAWSDFNNQYINIPAGVEDCSEMFAGVRRIKGTVQIPSSVKNCSHMFWRCDRVSVSLNQGIINCSELFLDHSFNNSTGSERIPSSVQNYTRMFAQSDNNWPTMLPGAIFFNAWQDIQPESFTEIFANRSNQRRCNVYCCLEFYNIFIEAGILANGVIPEWTNLTENGCYNTLYNIYIYNNYGSDY